MFRLNLCSWQLVPGAVVCEIIGGVLFGLHLDVFSPYGGVALLPTTLALRVCGEPLLDYDMHTLQCRVRFGVWGCCEGAFLVRVLWAALLVSIFGLVGQRESKDGCQSNVPSGSVRLVLTSTTTKGQVTHSTVYKCSTDSVTWFPPTDQKSYGTGNCPLGTYYR